LAPFFFFFFFPVPCAAYLPQESFLFNASILDNIKYGRPEATQDEVVAAATKACVHDVVTRLPKVLSWTLPRTPTHPFLACSRAHVRMDVCRDMIHS